MSLSTRNRDRLRQALQGFPGAQMDAAATLAVLNLLDGDSGPAGTNLTDTASQTIQITDTNGRWRKLPTLSQNGTLTLGTTGAVAGDQIEVTRTATGAFTYAIVNGGPGAGTLATFPASKVASAKFQFDGTNWALRSIGQLA